MSGGTRARAAVAFERGAPLRIEEITVRDPGPGEVRVRVAACGICASDLHVWRTGEGIGFPAVLGHEASGVVEAIGAGVTEVSEGQGVVLAWIPRCGTCRACRGGRTHLCAAMRTNADDGSLVLGGATLGRYMSVSGLSERVVVHERAATPVPEGLSLRSVCLIGCGVTTGFGAASARFATSVAAFAPTSGSPRCSIRWRTRPPKSSHSTLERAEVLRSKTPARVAQEVTAVRYSSRSAPAPPSLRPSCQWMPWAAVPQPWTRPQ